MAHADSKSQYSAAAHVPLIKSPSLRLPRLVELPPDVHPLPESVTPYFVYPFTLEPHIAMLESTRRKSIAAHAARREAYLRARDDEKERRKREALRCIAPGFDPMAPLVPMRTVSSQSSGAAAPDGGPHAPSKQRDIMDDLVDSLAAMESEN
ncbi:hypothetical protein FA95DRAFT_531228 [Auriscalpium vulgare]|uniref:Uncharacterized protein n=1 Tax=Auriscalpium vulgare TaxID=40419 RepID=A0ACB8RFD4_9AGAM|nr:hypothetical protein FA95DRAFT_531228 [Auriscalpium vulgare]